ncbi:CST complex subunit TEN1 isoform X2 [Coffea arabica]|uniref:CST complex subunit TEN1 isoform X2 n=1 Tax=Coffea arabica TaxID=13443 RepID=A0ABM4X8A6_COFAR
MVVGFSDRPFIGSCHGVFAHLLQEYDIETAIASIVEGNASLKIDTQHLKVNLRIGSLYQFIGELLIDPSNQAILRARVGRNVDGMDLNLYHQSLQLLRDFQAEQMNSTTS